MPKPRSQRPNNVVNMPLSDAENAMARPITEGSQEAVALRAFHLYCERGCTDGHDLDDWLQAERELRGDATSTAA
jgi:hypothetical protein